MSKEQPGKRDGTGPYKKSNESKTGNKGKRQNSGEKCPQKPKK